MGIYTRLAILVYITIAFNILTSEAFTMADVIRNNTIRQGSIVTQPSRSDTFANVKAKRTRNDFPLTQPLATTVETKYTNRFDDKGYYFSPDVIDGNP